MVTFLYWAVVCIVVAEFFYNLALTLLNVKASRSPIPPVLEGLYDEEKYRRQQEYSSAKRKLGVASTTAGTLVLLGLFCFGGFGWMDSVVRCVTASPVLQTIIFFAMYFVISEVVGLPFAICSTFRIEERFGFNKTTRRTFVADQIKNFLLNLLLQSILFGACAWIFQKMPQYFWLLAWAVMAVISLFLQYFYSQLIVPLFNKQTPLEDGELRSAIESFASRVGFKIKDIYVMDSSKRSTHANAYFTGFGPRKRIVLYDTLIRQLSVDEVVGVLAHEIGHYKRGHIVLNMITGLAGQLLMFFLLGLVLGSESMARAAGCAEASFHANMLVFSMLYAPIGIVTGILENSLSRRHERQADAFAKENGCGTAVASALKKMSAESLANLTPHPAVVFAEYSHPTLAERVNYLQV